MKENKDIEPISMLVSEVHPYPGNAKIHGPEQIAGIARSIKEFGFDQPVVVDKNNVIIKGHGRRLAAIELGYERIPVIVRRDLTDEEVRASRLADNKLAESEFDIQAINDELTFLDEMNFDVSVTGYDIDDILKEIAENAMESGVPDAEKLLADVSNESQESSDDTSNFSPTMPKGVDYEPKYEVVITCEDESDQESVYERMTKDGYKCRVLSV